MKSLDTPPAENPWIAGRFDGARRGSQVLFGRMYEDVAVELSVFRPRSRVFCIGSAGCTAFALAAAGHQVCAVDVNGVQIAYLRERADGRPYRPGSAERLIAVGRRSLWPRARIAEFLDLDNPAEQMVYWRTHLDTARFRCLTRLLLSAATLRLVYSARMVTGIPPRIDLELSARLERCWARFPNRGNPYARALFLGEAPAAPRFDARLLEIHHAEAAAFLEQRDPGQFDAFTLSNILDAAPGALRMRLFAAVKRAAAPGAIVLLRSFREIALPGISHASQDRSILWGTVQAMRAEEL